MMRELLIDAAVGETRTALIEDGRVAEIHIERWSEAGKFAPAGVRYCARVTTVDLPRGGAFVELGVGAPGWMPITKGEKGITEGAAAIVTVRAEAHDDKGPVLTFESLAEAGTAAPAILNATQAWGSDFDGEVEMRQAEIADRPEIDDAIEAALARSAPIPGGGRLWIEPTRALTAIDVDSAGRDMRGDTVKANRALISDAAAEIAFQARLRGLAGLLALDLPQLPRSRRKEAEQAVMRAFEGDPRRVEFSSISRFGIMQAARERTARPLGALMLDEDGRLSLETAALNALRALEREGASDRSARLSLRVAPDVAQWLKADAIGWRAALTERIGARFDVAADPGMARESADVRTL